MDLTPSDVTMGLMLLRWQSTQWVGGKSLVPSKYVLQQTEPVLDDIAAPVRYNLVNNAYNTSRLNFFSQPVKEISLGTPVARNVYATL